MGGASFPEDTLRFTPAFSSEETGNRPPGDSSILPRRDFEGHPQFPPSTPLPLLPFPTERFFDPAEDILVSPSLRGVFHFGEGGFPRGNLIPRWAAKETFAAFLSQGTPSPLPCPRRCVFGVHPRTFFVSCFYEFSRLALWHLKFVFMILNFNLFGIFLEQGRRI